jgi:membrane protease YdiL (CAAX protease family)
VAEPDPRALILLVFALLAVAISAWVLAPAFRGAERARRALGSHRLAVGSIVVVLFASNSVALLIPGLVNRQGTFDSVWQLLALALLSQLAMAGLVYVRVLAPRALAAEDLGLRPLSLPRVLGFGFLGWIGGLAILLLMGLLLQRLGAESNQLEQFGALRRASPFEFALAFVAIAVITPIVEELFFRGYLFGLYRRRHSLLVAYVAANLLFAILHANAAMSSPLQNLAVVVQAFALGCLLAFLYQWTGSLLPGMLAHALNNGMVVTLMRFSDLVPPAA